MLTSCPEDPAAFFCPLLSRNESGNVVQGPRECLALCHCKKYFSFQIRSQAALGLFRQPARQLYFFDESQVPKNEWQKIWQNLMNFRTQGQRILSLR